MAEMPSMTRTASRLLVTVALAASALLMAPSPAAFATTFSDVPASYWDHTAIQYVASTNTWMQDYGTSLFKPASTEIREYLARTLVTVYAPNEPIDPAITFPDLPKTDPFYRFANVATKLGWMPKYQSGNWAPNASIQVAGFDKAVVLALGLTGAVAGLQNIHRDDGAKYTVPTNFPYLQIGRTLQLHFNHTTESKDIGSTTLITRDEAAYSLWWAKTQMSWQLSSANRFAAGVSLPTLDPSVPLNLSKIQVTQYALNQVGYPYIWAGEWNAASPNGYCCGYQPVGGFDCSGFTWWVMKKFEGNYNAAQYRTYAGWSLLDRSSSYMAEHAPSHITWSSLRIGDLMFFAANGGNTWQDVDHVGIYVGNSWMMHSTGSEDGVTLEWVGTGTWWNVNYVWGRRLIGVGTAPGQRVDPTTALGGDRY
jgi:cell wall-associated NlpC family hydrolase